MTQVILPKLECCNCGTMNVIHEVSEWISVADRLPEINKIVLVYRANWQGYKENKIDIGYRNEKEGFRGHHGNLLDDYLYPHTLVTHWQALPEAPHHET